MKIGKLKTNKVSNSKKPSAPVEAKPTRKRHSTGIAAEISSELQALEPLVLTTLLKNKQGFLMDKANRPYLSTVGKQTGIAYASFKLDDDESQVLVVRLNLSRKVAGKTSAKKVR